jgi:hypothetical protein
MRGAGRLLAKVNLGKILAILAKLTGFPLFAEILWRNRVPNSPQIQQRLGERLHHSEHHRMARLIEQFILVVTKRGLVSADLPTQLGQALWICAGHCVFLCVH